MKTSIVEPGRKVMQAVGLIGLGLGLGIGGTFPLDQLRMVLLLAVLWGAVGGYLVFCAPPLPGRYRMSQGCGLIGFGLGLGMGGTFPDGTEWVTWLLCAFWCVVGASLLLRRVA